MQGTLVITKATPAISWKQPGDMRFGTILSAVQLNATADVVGNFVYTPVAGTALPVGSQTLSAHFVPNNSVNYSAVDTQVKVNMQSPEPGIQLSQTVVASRSSTGVVEVKLTVTNSGHAAAKDCTIASAKLGGLAPLDGAPAPQTIGSGGNALFVFRFPSAVGASGTSGLLTFSLNHKSGSSSVSVIITLP